MSAILDLQARSRPQLRLRRRCGTASACWAAASSAPPSRAGCSLGHPGLLRAIAVRNPQKARDVEWDAHGTAIRSRSSTIRTVTIVVECIGGVRLARELVLRAIAHGKDVVTANKELIAQDGPWLRAFAARTGATLHYEAAVGGAIPILRAAGDVACRRTDPRGRRRAQRHDQLRALADGAAVRRIRGGARAKRRQRGFAEADPRNDVEGFDTAHKLTILASLAFRRPVALRRRLSRARHHRDHAGGRRGRRRARLAPQTRRAGAPRGDGIEAGVVADVRRAQRMPSRGRTTRRTSCAWSVPIRGPLEFFGLGAGGRSVGVECRRRHRRARCARAGERRHRRGAAWLRRTVSRCYAPLNGVRITETVRGRSPLHLVLAAIIAIGARTRPLRRVSLNLPALATVDHRARGWRGAR